MSNSNTNTSRWFLFSNDHVLLLKQDSSTYHIPTFDYFTVNLDSFQKNARFIGNINNVKCYCAEIPADFSTPVNMSLIPLRQTLMQLEAEWFNALIKGIQIVQWDKNHQYCGRCGKTTIDKTSATVFEKYCEHCHLFFYPRISPSIIVRIQKGNQILMARSPHFTPGIYGLIAGFIEPGETAEAAVHREVMEEVGIEIQNVKYFGSQSWPFPDSLIFAFTADYLSGELRLDPVEIEAAGWYDKDHFPGLPSFRHSIALEMIDDFVANIS